MTKKSLHITNGDSLTDYLKSLNFEGEMLTWREMLCEGPTIPKIDSEAFFEVRKTFLNTYYNIELSDYNFADILKILDKAEDFDEINLWFEYDLFCHINLIAAISLLHQKELDNKPLYLICSGRVDGANGLKGLSELNPEQLKNHYQNRVLLNQDDIDLAVALWRTYCGRDHNIFKPYITQNSNFKYLTNCLKAHLKRFPHKTSGLCTLEQNILKLIKENKVKSRDHLVVYCLNYQGYYGFGDIQFKRMVNKLSVYFDESGERIKLNPKGKKALLGIGVDHSEVNNSITFGGVERLDFNFSVEENKLIKSSINDN